MSQFSWWHAEGLPAQVIAGQTVLASDNKGFDANFALHVGDHTHHVQRRRMQLLDELAPLGAECFVWLNQTHSAQVHEVTSYFDLKSREGDALITQQSGIGLMMMTADCLPIVLVSEEAQEIACIHAGWRGLAQNIIKRTVERMQYRPHYAWLGAAISQAHFEVGAEVREHFVAQDAHYATCFISKTSSQWVDALEKYQADLYAIARHQLALAGIMQVSGGQYCTYQQDQHWYSYRRNAITGRMVSFVCKR